MCVCVSVQVVVTVPLAVLKQGTISFTPPLTERKSGAIARMGAGVVEKVGGASGSHDPGGHLLTCRTII